MSAESSDRPDHKRESPAGIWESPESVPWPESPGPAGPEPAQTERWDQPEATETPTMVGSPELLAPYWERQPDGVTCGVYSQLGILNAFDANLTGEQLQAECAAAGELIEAQGMPFEQLGRALERHGHAIDSLPDSADDASAALQRLRDEVAQGKGVIVGVSTVDLWDKPGGGGHALWVTGLELDPGGEPVAVICNDTGRRDGERIHYAVDRFEAAWRRMQERGYQYPMVITKERIGLRE